jgi:hypothetical protein
MLPLDQAPACRKSRSTITIHFTIHRPGNLPYIGVLRPPCTERHVRFRRFCLIGLLSPTRRIESSDYGSDH